MYGDTKVQPGVLFDGTSGRPPADAIEVYFPTPMSLCLFGDAAHDNPDPHWVQQWAYLAELYGSVMNDAAVRVQHAGGYVTHPARGPFTPARLEMLALAHNSVPGEPIMRLHVHLYVGRTAAALADGTRHPVNRDKLRRAVDDVWSSYRRDLERRTAHDFGFAWAALPGHHPADKEIVDPPFAEHVDQHTPPHVAVCPGPYGQLDRMMADETSRKLHARSAAAIARERRAG